MIIPKIGVSEFVKLLALKHGICYERSQIDQFAEIITLLSGDEFYSDCTSDLLVALRRAQKITDRQMSSLLVNHLRETRHEKTS